HAPYKNRIIYTPDGVPKAFYVSYKDGNVSRHRIGFYNWNDIAASQEIPLSSFGLNAAAKWKATPLSTSFPAEATINEGRISVNPQPPHSLRIVELLETK
ncbi:MAG: hypothetical protein H0X41_12035, partial [Chitinophagaceae bacterium]|nr:hypothetical protein [Chitinophagaceae bacterium]